MADDLYTLRTSDVVRMLGLSPERIRQLDEELLPVRDISSRQRRYRLEDVIAVRSKRAQRHTAVVK